MLQSPKKTKIVDNKSLQQLQIFKDVYSNPFRQITRKIVYTKRNDNQESSMKTNPTHEKKFQTMTISLKKNTNTINQEISTNSLRKDYIELFKQAQSNRSTSSQKIGHLHFISNPSSPQRGKENLILTRKLSKAKKIVSPQKKVAFRNSIFVFDFTNNILTKQEINGGERLLKKNKLLVSIKKNQIAQLKVSKYDTNY